uniref:Uncharacterized protein n=1 Tax=Bursaphelenchus xylophilus TaxID=6326 RepID=A0A1I7SIL7_BURXY
IPGSDSNPDHGAYTTKVV